MTWNKRMNEKNNVFLRNHFCAAIAFSSKCNPEYTIQKFIWQSVCLWSVCVCVGEVENENKTRNRNRLLARLFLSNENDIYVLLNSHFLSFYNYSIGSKWWKRNANYKHTHECEEMCVCVCAVVDMIYSMQLL